MTSNQNANADATQVPLFTYSNDVFRFRGQGIYDTDMIDEAIDEDVAELYKAYPPAALGQWYATTQPDVDSALTDAWINAQTGESGYVLALIWRVAYDTRHEKNNDTLPATPINELVAEAVKAADAAQPVIVPFGPTRDHPKYEYNDVQQLLVRFDDDGEDDRVLFDTEHIRSHADGVELAQWFVNERPVMTVREARAISGAGGWDEEYLAAREWRDRYLAAKAAPIAQPAAENVLTAPAQPAEETPQFDYTASNLLVAQYGDRSGRVVLYDTDYINGHDEAALALANWFTETQPAMSKEDANKIAGRGSHLTRYLAAREWRDRYLAAKAAPVAQPIALPTGRLVASIAFNPINVEEASAVYNALRSLGYNVALDGGTIMPDVAIVPEQAAS